MLTKDQPTPTPTSTIATEPIRPATTHPGNIALTNPGDDDHGGGYPEIHPEPQPDRKPATHPDHRPERPIHTPLTDSVKSDRYKKLTQAECIVLGMLDNCCPHTEDGPDAVSWFCPWDKLVKLASVAPAIADDRIMGAIGNLREYKIIDCCVGTSNGEPGVFVAKHQHRAMLLHNFMQHTIAEKRKLVDQVASAA